jgi:hypothetical protein
MLLLERRNDAVIYLLVSGITEKHKQRSSTEGNNNEHCDYWMSVAPSP